MKVHALGAQEQNVNFSETAWLILIKSSSSIEATDLSDMLWFLYSIQKIADNFYEMIISGE
jgi:hypothetical protein